MLESASSRGLQKKRAAMARLKVRGVRKWSRRMLRERGGVPGEELDRDGKEGAVNFCPRDTGVTGGGAWAKLGEGRSLSLPADDMVGGVVADVFEGGAAGGGVARAPKNDRMLFWALIPRNLRSYCLKNLPFKLGCRACIRCSRLGSIAFPKTSARVSVFH
jgi:hypothetical protein